MAPFASRPELSAHLDDADLGVIANGTLVAERGRIVAAGTHEECAAAYADVGKRARDRFEVIDARGALVMPGLIDAHTHALYAGSRIGDFEALAHGDAHLVPVLIGEDIVGDGLTDRATSGDARR